MQHAVAGRSTLSEPVLERLRRRLVLLGEDEPAEILVPHLPLDAVLTNLRGASANTLSTTRYVSAWFPYRSRSSLSMRKSWSLSSSQNLQYMT